MPIRSPYLLICGAMLCGGAALADPPARVARLAYASGTVSLSPAGDDSWQQASINLPLVAGDRLWAADGARDELQAGPAAVRMGGGTLVTLLNANDTTTQLQLSQGRLNLRVRQMRPDEVLEIDTPNLAFNIRKPGHYRLTVDASGNATQVSVVDGQGEAYGDGQAYLIDPGQSYRFGGTGLRDFAVGQLPPADDLDQWAAQRDRRAEHPVSVRYVSSDVVGYEDLDDNGNWRNVSGYGDVWMPSHVASDWAPYRDGRWTWVDPWGWTWVDNAPWGFAVTHYGRWANTPAGWGWVPGPVAQRPVYAPALVVFVGAAALMRDRRPDDHGVAWFPLGPHEVYRPPYRVSQNYVNNVNVSNTVVNRTQITNVYNNVNVTNIRYVNRVPGAVTAVPGTAFAQSQQVSRAAVRIAPQALAAAPVMALAPAAPQHGRPSGEHEGARPAAALLARPVMARTAPQTVAQGPNHTVHLLTAQHAQGPLARPPAQAMAAAAAQHPAPQPGQPPHEAPRQVSQQAPQPAMPPGPRGLPPASSPAQGGDPRHQQQAHQPMDVHAQATPHSQPQPQPIQHQLAESHAQAAPHPQPEQHQQAEAHAQAAPHPQQPPHQQAEAHAQAAPHPQQPPHQQAEAHVQVAPHPQPAPHQQAEAHAQAAPHPQPAQHQQAEAHAQAAPHPQPQQAEAHREAHPPAEQHARQEEPHRVAAQHDPKHEPKRE